MLWLIRCPRTVSRTCLLASRCRSSPSRSAWTTARARGTCTDTCIRDCLRSTRFSTRRHELACPDTRTWSKQWRLKYTLIRTKARESHDMILLELRRTEASPWMYCRTQNGQEAIDFRRWCFQGPRIPLMFQSAMCQSRVTKLNPNFDVNKWTAYIDSEVVRSGVDVARDGDLFGDVLDGKRLGNNARSQLDEHVSLVALERPTVTRLNRSLSQNNKTTQTHKTHTKPN